MNEDMELNLDELDNILAGGPREAVEKVVLENSDSYRKEQIERLQEEKEKLMSSDRYDTTVRRGR